MIVEGWRYCADHEFYGKRKACPRCGKVGVVCVLDEDGELQPDYPDRCERGQS